VKFGILFKNELKLLSLTRGGMIAVFFFAFLVLFLLSVVLKKSAITSHDLTYQSLLISIVLSALFRLQRSFEEESKSSVMTALKLAGVSPLQLIIAKALVNIILLIKLTLFSFIVSILLFNVAEPLLLLTQIGPVLCLGLLGIAFIGTFISGISAQHEKRELLLTILLFPILFPMLIALVNAPQYDVYGIITGIESVWLKVLLGFDLIFALLLWMLAEPLMEGINS